MDRRCILQTSFRTKRLRQYIFVHGEAITAAYVPLSQWSRTMKLIDKMFRVFGYVRADRVQADLDFVLDLFNIKSIEELRLQKADFKILSDVLMDGRGVSNRDKIQIRKELNAGEFTSLQDKIEDLMAIEGFTCKFEDLPKKKRQEIFMNACNTTDDT
jgi:hypothetical protein